MPELVQFHLKPKATVNKTLTSNNEWPQDKADNQGGLSLIPRTYITEVVLKPPHMYQGRQEFTYKIMFPFQMEKSQFTKSLRLISENISGICLVS